MNIYQPYRAWLEQKKLKEYASQGLEDARWRMQTLIESPFWWKDGLGYRARWHVRGRRAQPGLCELIVQRTNKIICSLLGMSSTRSPKHRDSVVCKNHKTLRQLNLTQRFGTASDQSPVACFLNDLGGAGLSGSLQSVAMATGPSCPMAALSSHG